jgi:hypothetical protein
VVHVGEFLTFTIYIRNDSAFTVTVLPLTDQYNQNVLAYADASVTPDAVDEVNGQIDWNDLTIVFGDLPPGGEILVVVGFVAEHPEPAVVNAAEVHDAVGSGGELGGGNSVISNTESIGGSSPVDKELMAGLQPQVGLPLTFTITVTNSGYTTMTVVPLTDVYNPAWMAFSYAEPMPDGIDEVNGILTWSDLTLAFGDIPAQGSVTVLTVFTALTSVDNASNSAEVVGAIDWYENDMAGGADLVPITIIIVPTATPGATAAPTAVATRRPSATQAPAATVSAPTPTSTMAPLLPQTGEQAGESKRSDGLLIGGLALGLGVVILSVGLAIRRRRRT